MTERPFVSIVIPTLEGATRLPAALDSLQRQEYPAHRIEIIVVDGGSQDNSRAVAERFGARVIDNPRRRVAPARNAGFAASRGDIVGFTDDDCTFPATWISNAVRHLGGPDLGGVGGPTWIPDDETAFGRAVAEIFALASHVTGAVHRETVDAVREATDLPGCNVFFRREALLSAMPSDESLVTAEDVELCLQVRRAGHRLALVPDIGLWHHKRPTPRGLWRQMYRYAIGRLQVGRRERSLLRPAHIATGLFVPLAILAVVLLAVLSPSLLLAGMTLTALALAVLGAASAWRRSTWGVAAWIPVVVLIVPTAWSLGFLRELISPVPTEVSL